MERKIVYFEWRDACGRDGWVSARPDGLPQVPLVKSIGWLVHEDDDQIVITSGWEVEQDGCMGVIAVPKAWIKKRRYVKL
jgi:hypothetical protein